MKRKSYFPTPNTSVSHGTLKTDDLVAAFLNELWKFDEMSDYDTDLRERAAAWLDSPEPRDDDEGDCLRIELADALQEHAPPYTIFEANEGDGSDFGWWACVEWLEEDTRQGADSVLKINAGDDIPLSYDGEFVMQVNDHGNVTLLQRSRQPNVDDKHRHGGGAWVEVWSCV